MRKTTPPLLKSVVKVLPLSLLAVAAMPAHSLWIDTPNVRDGLQFNIYNSVYPRVSTTSDKLTYVLGDPALYGANGTLEQVLRDQGRKENDERARLQGTSSLATQFVGRQAINKDWTAVGTIYLQYNPNSTRNWGAPWGISLASNAATVALGTTFAGLDVGQTDADSVLAESGTAVSVEYTDIPNFTVNAFHMLTQSSDNNDRTEFGWHKNNGLSASYTFNFAPRNELKVAAGATISKGHDSPWYVNQTGKAKGYMGSVSYQYGNLKLAADYGESEEKFNGVWFDELNTKSYGVKATYKFTPRLTSSLSYSHLTADNTKPVTLAEIAGRRIGLNDERYFFDKTKKDRYKFETSYNVWRGIDVIGSVENAETRHYVAEGQLTERKALTTTAGARFTF